MVRTVGHGASHIGPDPICQAVCCDS
jgi:hypothetical protein